jgi:hypothetical protein
MRSRYRRRNSDRAGNKKSEKSRLWKGKRSGSGAMRPSSSFLVKEREKRREEERGENGKSGTRGERVEV